MWLKVFCFINTILVYSVGYNASPHVTDKYKRYSTYYRRSYMSAHVLLNLLNKLRKRDKMRGLLSILSLYCNKFNKYNNTGTGMLDSIYHMTLKLL